MQEILKLREREREREWMEERVSSLFFSLSPCLCLQGAQDWEDVERASRM